MANFNISWKSFNHKNTIYLKITNVSYRHIAILTVFIVHRGAMFKNDLNLIKVNSFRLMHVWKRFFRANVREFERPRCEKIVGTWSGASRYVSKAIYQDDQLCRYTPVTVIGEQSPIATIVGRFYDTAAHNQRQPTMPRAEHLRIVPC